MKRHHEQDHQRKARTEGGCEAVPEQALRGSVQKAGDGTERSEIACAKYSPKGARQNWLQSGKPGTQIARELGVSYPTPKQWKRCYWGDAMTVRPDLESEPSGAR